MLQSGRGNGHESTVQYNVDEPVDCPCRDSDEEKLACYNQGETDGRAADESPGDTTTCTNTDVSGCRLVPALPAVLPTYNRQQPTIGRTTGFTK
ncbi:hypothetical protein J6590_010458 [Homalodisca vitripennis]|nr:hypothetical protein J6590_010458 [Homalodisca vitripennis]